jgi:hypothetical protein
MIQNHKQTPTTPIDHRTGATVPSHRRDTGPYYYKSISSSSIASTTTDGVAEVEVETAALRAARTRQAGRFLKGPIPLTDITVASRLPGRALAVFLAIHYWVALTRNPEVTLPKRLLAELGVTRDGKARALHALEGAGLARVERQRGRQPKIKLPTQHQTKKRP